MSPPLLLRHGFALAFLALFPGPGAFAQCLSWSPEFAGTPVPDVFALASFDDGSGPAVYVASTSFVRRYDGAGWSVVGNGTGFLPGTGQTYTPSVLSLAVFDDGSGAKLYAGGRFESVDGVPAACLAKWDGAAWSSAGDPLNPGLTSVLAMTVADFGSGPRLFRANEGTQALDADVARFDGSVWSSIGSLAQGAIGFVRVTALAAHDDGGGPALYAGGTFASANGVPATNVARWDPALGTWSAVGAGLDNSVYALASHAGPSGPSLWAGGLFAQNLSVFDGSTWSVPAGGANGIVRAFTIADEGDGPALFAGGEFTQIGGVAASLVARRQGSTWVPLGAGLSLPGTPFAWVTALVDHEGGATGQKGLFAGGRFTRAAETASRLVARWRGCPGPIDEFCPGDGTLVTCPCGNNGLGGRGCQNSLSTGGAHLASSGATNPDTLLLQATGEMPSALTIFLQGNTRIPSGTSFGDGLRCVGGALKRLYVKVASGGAVSAPGAGDPSISARSAALGDPIAPGTLRYYQTYYRDAAPNFCSAPTGSTFNASSGVRVAW